MEDKVATLKSKRNQSVNGDDADSDPPSDEEQTSNAERLMQPRSWNMMNYWEYVDSLLADLRSGLEVPGARLSLEQQKKQYNA